MKRKEKIRLLKDIENGKTSIQDEFPEPITGMVFHHPKGYVFMYCDTKTRVWHSFEPSIPLTEFNERFKDR